MRGSFSEEHQCINLQRQLKEILASSLIMHPKLNAKTDLQVDPNLNIQTNVSLLNQIVSNILSNAYTHAFQDREDNQIQISASIEQGFVNISIQNNGVAIPPEVAEHMFEPFFTTNRSKGGTGLGLSAAFNAVTLLKGSMSYQADSSLGGAQFNIRIPLNQCDAPKITTHHEFTI